MAINSTRKIKYAFFKNRKSGTMFEWKILSFPIHERTELILNEKQKKKRMKDAFDFLRQKYQTKIALFVKWIE